MGGTCLALLGKISKAYSFYQKAVSYDDSNAFINREIERFRVKHHLIESTKQHIWHYFPNTTNIGDSGAAAGIRALFKSLTEDLFFFSLSCRNDTVDKLQTYTTKPIGVVIGGGGLFFSQPLPSGWYFPLHSSEIINLTLPVITYAIGFNREFSNETPWILDDSFIKNIAAYHKAFTIKSVRDKWSKEILERKGVSDLHLVPCPSAFLEPLPWFSLKHDTSMKIVGLSITDRSLSKDRKHKIFPVLFGFARWLSQEGFTPLFILQDTADDLPLAKLINENNFACIVPNTAREAITIYDQCYSVLGMRGHSLILAAGRSVPILAIAYNKKIDAFMETLDLQQYCLNQNEIIEEETLIKNFKRLLARRDDIIGHLKKKREIFYNLNINYCKYIISILSTHTRNK